jgi:hypothetical protein
MADKKYSVAFDAVITKLSGALPALVDIVQYPNQPPRIKGSATTKQPSNENWIRLSLIPTASTNVATGGGQTWVRRNGLIAVDVFTPKGSSLVSNQTICDDITALFENTEFGNVKTFEATTAKIEDEPWLGYQVTINFYCEGL